MTSKKMRKSGFTIVELLIVIVVIGILAAITIVTFNGVQERARISLLKSDLVNASRQLKVYQVTNGKYPDTANGLTASSGVTYSYGVDNSSNPQTFCLTATDGNLYYYIRNIGTPAAGNCTGIGATAERALVVDGITTSTPYLDKGSGVQSTTVTLDKVYDISTIKVWHYYADGRTYNDTKTEVSEDGVNWVTVFDSATEGTYQETSAGKTHSFSPIKARYIRDWTNGSNINTSNHWVEIQVY